jgi:hypothetical protein
LEPVVGGAVRAKTGVIQCGPLAAGAQKKENGIGAVLVRTPGASPAKPMGVDPLRQKLFHFLPERSGHTVSKFFNHPQFVPERRNFVQKELFG